MLSRRQVGDASGLRPKVAAIASVKHQIDHREHAAQPRLPALRGAGTAGRECRPDVSFCLAANQPLLDMAVFAGQKRAARPGPLVNPHTVRQRSAQT